MVVPYINAYLIYVSLNTIESCLHIHEEEANNENVFLNYLEIAVLYVCDFP